MILSLLSYQRGENNPIIYLFTLIGKFRSRKSLLQVMHTGDSFAFSLSNVYRTNSPWIPCSEIGRFMDTTTSNIEGFSPRMIQDGQNMLFIWNPPNKDKGHVKYRFTIHTVQKLRSVNLLLEPCPLSMDKHGLRSKL